MKTLKTLSIWTVLTVLLSSPLVAATMTDTLAVALPRERTVKPLEERLVAGRVSKEKAEVVRFSRGDANSDGEFNMSDILTTVGWLFLGQRDPACHAAADMDDNGEVELADAVRASGYLFLGAKALPAPFPGCGEASRGSRLSCEDSPCQDSRNEEKEEAVEYLMFLLEVKREVAERVVDGLGDDADQLIAAVVEDKDLDLVNPRVVQEAICLFGTCICFGDADCDILMSSDTCVDGTRVCHDVDGETVCTCEDAS